MIVSFVGQYRGRAQGGLGRYEDELFRHLELVTQVRYLSARPPVIPRLLRRLGSLAGRDVQAVANHCPLIPDRVDGSVVHLANQNLAAALVFQRPATSVVTVHDVIPFLRTTAAAGASRVAERIIGALRLAGLRRSARIIADSAFTKQELVHRFGFAAGKIVVVPLGVDLDLYKRACPPASFRARYGIQPERPFILYVGSQAPRKNLATLYRAFAKARLHVPAVDLVIVGAERTPFRATIDRLGLPELGQAVRYFGHVPEQDLSHFFSAAAAFALPSLYEGFGLPALEALACGCPVIAARAASLPEVVGEAGLLVEPLDVDAWSEAIVTVLTDQQHNSRLREVGVQRARQFSWQRTAEATLSAYEQAAAS